MCKKLMFLISLVMVLGAVASADDYSWTNDYPWSYLYISPWNWEPEAPYGGPGSGDTAYIGTGEPIVLDTDITVENIRGPAWQADYDDPGADQIMYLVLDCNLFVENRWEMQKTGDHTGYIEMSEDAKVYIDGRFLAHGDDQRVVINMKDNAEFVAKDDVRIGDEDNDYFELNMTDNAYFYAGNDDDGMRQNDGELHITIDSNAILEAEYARWRMRTGPLCTLDVSENGQFIINDDHFEFCGGDSSFIINLSNNAVMDVDGEWRAGEDNSFGEDDPDVTWTLNMPCGDSPTLNIGDTLKMIYNDEALGRGIINLEGGVITAAELDSETDNWVINICCEGLLVLDGDVVDDMLEYALEGHIVGCPAEDCWGEITPSADIVAEYDNPNYPGKTMVWAELIYGRTTGPRPRDGETGVPKYAELCWCPSNLNGPTTYHIFLSEDEAEVAAGSLHAWKGAQTGTCFTTDPLCLGKTYYWRVDSVDDCNFVEGTVWEFTVEDHQCIEEFETYDNNDLGNPIWNTWLDGCGNDGTNGNGTGSCVYSSTTVVHSGGKSMMYLYDCSGQDMAGDERDCNYAEATRALEPQDWTVACIEAIEVWFYGDPDNDNGPDEAMFMVISDTADNEGIVYYGATAPEDLADMLNDEWQQWDIALADFAGQGVNLTLVDSIALGFGDRTNCHDRKGGWGLMYFDDICLFPCRCIVKYTPNIVDINGDCKTNMLDLKLMVDNWLTDRRCWTP